jgi:hypothetical protein
MASVLLYYVPMLFREWEDPERERLFRVLLTWFVVQVSTFTLFYGDVQINMPLMFVNTALLIVNGSPSLQPGQGTLVEAASPESGEKAPVRRLPGNLLGGL